MSATTIWLRSTASTMSDAAALAERGAAHGTVVVAEAQTAGIGRHGHSWHSQDQGGLYVSLILRLNLQPRDLPLLTMALGLAVQETVNRTASVASDIRWPNDILLNGKKIAGILVQTPASGVQIAGIGLNLNQRAFPDDIASLATSLLIATGQEQAKEPIMDRMTAACLREAEALASGGRDSVLARFEKCSSGVRGVAVEVTGPRVIRGVTDGLDNDGFLRVLTEGGVETIVTGGVRPVQG
jgi:BirA family biotin operon repressor/biotin-[acetyl-CoA-carboxylase] ligase